VAKPRLHLDADTSIRQLQRVLVERGHDVTRTPNDWISQDASDEAQLLGATAQGRVIFTFNVRDFVALAARHPQHRGIALAAQRQWTVSVLLEALDRMLTETTAEEWVGQVKWLAHWRPPGGE
jgi:hypothetical protein